MKVYVWWVQAMGMATMLDEIINYVQSLQNQVEVNNLSCNHKLHISIRLCLLVFWRKKKKTRKWRFHEMGGSVNTYFSSTFRNTANLRYSKITKKKRKSYHTL